MPRRVSCRGRTRKGCKSAKKSCTYAKGSVRAKGFCRTRKNTKRRIYHI